LVWNSNVVNLFKLTVQYYANTFHYELVKCTKTVASPTPIRLKPSLGVQWTCRSFTTEVSNKLLCIHAK